MLLGPTHSLTSWKTTFTPNIVVIDLVNEDNDKHPDNENYNDVENERQCQRQIEEVAEAEEDCLYEVEHLCTIKISGQMTAASVSNYVPGITQINCVKNGMSIANALTKGGDNITLCERCGNHDPEGCFWVSQHQRTENERSSSNVAKCKCAPLSLWLFY